MPSRPAVITLIHLDHDSPATLRAQVYDRMRELIVAGHLARGARLPSTRALAAELCVSRNTIVAAFDQLVAEGYLRGRTGSGHFVSDDVPDRLTETTARGTVTPKRVPREPQSATQFTRAFALGIPAIDEFPYEIWRRLVAKRWRRPGTFAGYGATAGLRGLRRAVACHVTSARGASCDAEQVFIVGGAQQGFDLTARVVLERGDAVWIEDPGYAAAASAFRAAGATLVPIPLDGEGMDVARGAGMRAPRLIYTTPSHQFPFGVTMSMPRRRQLLDVARSAGSWILEDDYDSEFRYRGQPLPALQGMEGGDRVIYAGSFSKGLLPGLRLGYLVAPPSLVSRFTAACAVAGAHPSLADQAVVAEFMTDGHFARHIRRMRELYLVRRDALVGALASELGGLASVKTPDAGTHLVARLPDHVDDRSVCIAARELGVIALPLSDQFVGDYRTSGLLLGYGGIRETLIPRAVRALASASPLAPSRPRVRSA